MSSRRSQQAVEPDMVDKRKGRGAGAAQTATKGSTASSKKPSIEEPTQYGLSLRSWSRLTAVVVLAALIAARQSQATGRSVMAEFELPAGTLQKTSCAAKDYRPRVPGCTPTICGQLRVDDMFSPDEVKGLRSIAERGMVMGGGSGGPTILDLQSGALSLEDKFVDVWTAFNLSGRRPFTRSDVAVYATATERLAAMVESTFGVRGVHLTSPTFFSRISADRPPKIPNDEYWHPHVDKLQYGSFMYTALVYLSRAGDDFEGGSLRFLSPKDKSVVASVSPRPGTVVMFTSGHDNPHHVEQVTSGTRLALTVAFTCDSNMAIQDFLGRAVPDDAVADE